MYIKDDNECSVANGGCSDICNNTVGSYFCSCPVGKIVGSDLKTCEGKRFVSSFILSMLYQ